MWKTNFFRQHVKWKILAKNPTQISWLLLKYSSILSTDPAFAVHTEKDAHVSESLVILNQGSHYSETAENFVCPVNRLYIFTLTFVSATAVTLLPYKARIDHASIDPLMFIVVRQGRYGHGTIMAVCTPGASVSIVRDNIDNNITFSGALMSRKPQHSTTVSWFFYSPKDTSVTVLRVLYLQHCYTERNHRSGSRWGWRVAPKESTQFCISKYT